MSPSTAESRTAVKLPQSVQRNLSAYAHAAGAAGVSVLALAQPAEAQIIYTPTNKTISSGEKLLIDFNRDGIVDVIVREGRCSWETYFPGNSLQAEPQHVGGGIQRHYRGIAAALSPDSKIGPRANFNYHAAVMATFTNYGVYYFGSWAFAPTSYLGIKFPINGETHYGWARLTVTPTDQNIIATLSGYAYETQPDTPIHAGDTGKNDAYHSDDTLSMSESAAKPARTLGALAGGAPSLPRCGYEEAKR